MEREVAIIIINNCPNVQQFSHVNVMSSYVYKYSRPRLFCIIHGYSGHLDQARKLTYISYKQSLLYITFI